MSPPSLAQQFFCVGRLHRTAIPDGQCIGSRFVVQLATTSRMMAVTSCACSVAVFAGTDCSNRLVSDDDVGKALPLTPEFLVAAYDLGDTQLPLLEHFADAEDDLQSSIQSSADSCVDRLIGFTKVLFAPESDR